jgi:hypothetical protein
MDGTIYESDTNGAYHVCSECRRGIVGPCWLWTEAKRHYFCSSEHAQEWQRRGGPPPKPEPVAFIDDEEIEIDDDMSVPKKPSRIRRWWRSLSDG